MAGEVNREVTQDPLANPEQRTAPTKLEIARKVVSMVEIPTAAACLVMAATGSPETSQALMQVALLTGASGEVIKGAIRTAEAVKYRIEHRDDPEAKKDKKADRDGNILKRWGAKLNRWRPVVSVTTVGAMKDQKAEAAEDAQDWMDEINQANQRRDKAEQNVVTLADAREQALTENKNMWNENVRLRDENVDTRQKLVEAQQEVDGLKEKVGTTEARGFALSIMMQKLQSHGYYVKDDVLRDQIQDDLVDVLMEQGVKGQFEACVDYIAKNDPDYNQEKNPRVAVLTVLDKLWNQSMEIRNTAKPTTEKGK